MRAYNRGGRDKTKRLRLRPHAKWADKFIALYQGTLPEAEREDVERHLRECLACSEAYLVYTEVAGIVQNRSPLEAPPGLPPALQELKDKQLAQTSQHARKLEAPATTKQTLIGVTDEPPRKRRPAQKAPPPATPSTDSAPPASAPQRRGRG